MFRSNALVAGLIADVPFLAMTGLTLFGVGYIMVVLALLVGLTRLRKIGSGLVVGGLAAYLLL